ncbi:hypothetical protein SESBI_27437 [Sesbania bispinosa]|nr:hypothetical protein SESBI_27437 [Sesbania bispinosa]
MDFITLILHHGGKLLRNEQRVLEYVGGEVDVWEEIDCDLLNRFLIIDLCKLHKYHDIQHCYWLYPERDLDLGLREIRKDCDADIVDLCLASKHNNGEIEVFFEHPVIPDERVVFSKVVVDENTGVVAEDSSVEVVGQEPGKGGTDTSVEVVGEEHVERDGVSPVDVIVEEAADMEEVSHVEVVVQEGTEREELSPVEVAVEESAEMEEENHDDVVVEEVSKDDDEDSPIVAEIRSKKKNDLAARNTDKGKNVVGSNSGRKGKNVQGSSFGRKGKKNVAESSKKRRVVTSEESSEDDGEGNPLPSGGVGHRQSYAQNLNVGPRGWKPVETTEVPARPGDGTATPINPTTATENLNETQTEIDLSQSQPTSQSSQPQPVHTNQGFPPTPNQPLVSAKPTQTTRLAPMGQVRPNTPFRQPGLIDTTVARPTYRGTTRRKLPTREGGLSIRPHAGGARQNASSSPTTAANQTSTAGPFLGASSSTRPSTIKPSTISPTSAAGPYLGASSSTRPSTINPTSLAGPFQGASASSPINFRTRGTTSPSSAAGPFQGASASTYNRFMQFMPTPGFHPPPPKKP